MITLSIIIFIWTIISTYRLYNISKKNKESFNPFAGTVIDYLGFLIGYSVIIVWVICLIIFYLP